MPGRASPVKTLRLESREHGVKQLILSRPGVRNAFDETMIAELKEVLRELVAISDPEEVRLLLLSGEGPVFCAGADVNYMTRLAASGESESLVDARALAQLFYALAAFPTPVICTVRGAAIGGGLGLAVCADFVLAEEKATFATTEVRLGIVPGVISPYVVRKIGGGSAAPLLLSGRRVKAPEARELGLVQQIVPSDGCDAALDDLVLEFLHAGPEAARRTKQLVLRAAPLPTPEHIELTARAIATARCSAEGQTGLSSFFDKKTPPWVP
jgi:methylglutaconyl-CoA hydratase